MVLNVTFNNILVISWRLHSITKIGYSYLFLGEIDLSYKTRSVCGSNYLLFSFRRANEFLCPRDCTSPSPPLHPKNEVRFVMFKYVWMKLCC